MDLDSVLKQMRTEYTPDAEDKRRVETALTATLLAGSVTGAAHLAGSTVGLKGAIAKGSLELLPVWLKGAIGVSATVAAVGAGLYGVNEYRSQEPTSHVVAASEGAGTGNAAKVSRAAVAAPLVVPQVAAERAPLPVSEPVLETRVAAPTNHESATPRVAARANHSHAAVPHHAVPSVPLTSLGELQLIGEASRALQEGRSDDAQRVLREHERRYTNTALGQERTGLALLARCTNDDVSARVDAVKFLQTNPNSPLATRLKRECIK